MGFCSVVLFRFLERVARTMAVALNPKPCSVPGRVTVDGKVASSNFKAPQLGLSCLRV